MTVTIQLPASLLNTILALTGIAVTIGTTWYFARRHYTKESRAPTRNDVYIHENKLLIWSVAIVMGGLVLIIALIAFAGSSS